MTKAKRFIDHLVKHPEKYTYLKPSLNDSLICMALLTVYRREQYIYRTLHSLVENTTKREFQKDLNFIIVDAIPNRPHPDLDKVRGLFEVVPMPEHNRSNFYVEQTMTQIFGMEMCKKRGKYVLIIEDDAIVKAGYISRIKDAVLELENTKNWLYLKLFFPEERDIYGLGGVAACFLFSLLIGSFVTIVYLCCRTVCSKSVVYRSECVLLFGFTFWFSLLIVFGIGNQNVPFKKEGLKLFYNDASTVAQLYPSYRINELVRYLRSTLHQKFPPDLHIGRYGFIRGLEKYILRPYLFDHIGKISTRSYKDLL